MRPSAWSAFGQSELSVEASLSEASLWAKIRPAEARCIFQYTKQPCFDRIARSDSLRATNIVRSTAVVALDNIVVVSSKFLLKNNLK